MIPWRSITASRLWRGISGYSARDSRTVHRFGARHCAAGQRELAPDEAIVETHVVRDEHAPREARAQFLRDVLERRRIDQHVVVDAGQRGDAGRNAPARVHQALPLELHFARTRADHGHVDDAMPPRRAARGLDVDEGDRRVRRDS